MSHRRRRSIGPDDPLERLELDHSWSARVIDGPTPDWFDVTPVPARVPGLVHGDLIAAGRIPDPHDGTHEADLLWLGRTTWRVTMDAVLELPEAERHDLVLDGIDTVATVRVNGTEVARTANQHRTYRLDVTGHLLPGRNLVEVDLAAALPYAESEERRLGARPRSYPHPFAMIRKAACSFGWDWGPEIVTAGLWRPVAIESWSGVRLAAVRMSARADGTATAAVELERAGQRTPVEVCARVGGEEVRATVAGDRADLTLRVDQPDLWWPRTHGEPTLYDAEVTAGGDRRSLRVGFRTITVDSEPDEGGRPFRLRVNDRPVQVRGANWIPLDTLSSRVTDALLDERLEDAVAGNLNTLRVWGGGVFESDAFYDGCDERGIMVWQDFLFACAAYPEEEPLRTEVRAEVVDAVDRLSSHPSLTLWNGGNENIWAHHDWGWAPELEDRTWGEHYYRDLIPAVLASRDPDRVYIENSPFSWDVDTPPNDPGDGLVHIWDVWNEVDWQEYSRWRPRFVSEFGFQGPPAWSTLVSAVHDDPLSPDGPQLLAHQKAENGQEKIARSLALHCPPVGSMADWHWAAQLNQADAVRHAIEHFRSLTPSCDGAIVWQLNDCWPVVSWSAVDSAGVRKPMWFAMRDAFADRLALLGEREVVLVNDADEPWSPRPRVSWRTLDGIAVHEWDDGIVPVPHRTTVRVPLPVELRDLPGTGMRVLRAAGARGQVVLDESPARRPLPPARFESAVRRTDSGYEVEVRAQGVVHHLTLLPDRLDPAARVDDALVDLLPGETARFRVATDVVLDPAALLAAPTLRTLNDLSHGGARAPVPAPPH